MFVRYMLLWPALLVLAIGNAALRQGVIVRLVSALRAQQISWATAALLFFVFTWFVHKYWPLRSTGEAMRVGAVWVAMTVAFEFFMITVLGGKPVSVALAQYDLPGGNLWSLLLVALFVTPVTVRAMQRRS